MFVEKPHFDECVILFLKAFIYCLFLFFYVCVGLFHGSSWITDWHWNAFNMYLYVCVGVLVISPWFAWTCKHVSTYVVFDVSIYRYGTLNTETTFESWLNQDIKHIYIYSTSLNTTSNFEHRRTITHIASLTGHCHFPLFPNLHHQQRHREISQRVLHEVRFVGRGWIRTLRSIWDATLSHSNG